MADNADNNKLISPKNVTQREIARLSGVTQQAVSRALRDDPLISAETRLRVQTVAEQLGYDPAQFQAARRMSMIRTGNLPRNNMAGLIAPTGFSDHTYFVELFRGVMHTLSERGVDLTITLDVTSDTIPQPARRGEIDGIISMVRPEWMNNVLPQLRKLANFGNRPMVSLLWPIPNALSVLTDDEQAGYLAMKHLLELGHRKIMVFEFLMKPNDPEMRRQFGMKRAISELSLTDDVMITATVDNPHWDAFNWITPPTFDNAVSPDHYKIINDDNNPVSLAQYLSEHHDITAIIALNDPSAIIAYYLLEQAGYSVPRDISLVGFDDTDPIPDAEGRNILTTVRIPLRRIGEEAAKLLLRRLDNDVEDDTRVILPPSLTIRATTGKPGRK